MCLGKRDSDKIRPLKVIMNNSLEKDSVMRSLKKLKEVDEVFKRVSITDDYTTEERAEISSWVDKAKMKNSEEGENCKHIWRVRGTPKNGLRLVKFTKRRQNGNNRRKKKENKC